MSSNTQHEDDDGDDDVGTSKLGVLVPEDVQQDNRSLVLYRNDGSKRNKLGPETTDRITHGLAMYFWRHPSELEQVAHSKYVDDPEDFKNRIQRYQNKHLEDTLVVARDLLHGSLAQNSPQYSNSTDENPPDETGSGSPKLGGRSKNQNRLGGIPQVANAPQDGGGPQHTREQTREELNDELLQLVRREVREQMEVHERRVNQRLAEIEDTESGSDDEKSTPS